jgi:phytoene desaturase
VVEAVAEVAKLNGTTFHYNLPVDKIIIEGDTASGIVVNNKEILCDAVVATADYAHVEHELLPASKRNYNSAYWKKKTFAPSCLIYYIGISKRIKSIQHHTLFFDEELLQHSKEIYKDPQWPAKPLFYVCCPSQSDANVAPSGHENLFLLMPIAPGLEDNMDTREKYFQIMVSRLEKALGEELINSIDYKKSYCISDFIEDYHSYKGNAYGLANTLMQTAVLKPKIRNKKINNLFYAGQLTVPGPGVPPSLISGKIAAQQLLKQLNVTSHEVAV